MAVLQPMNLDNEGSEGTLKLLALLKKKREDGNIGEDQENILAEAAAIITAATTASVATRGMTRGAAAKAAGAKSSLSLQPSGSSYFPVGTCRSRPDHDAVLQHHFSYFFRSVDCSYLTLCQSCHFDIPLLTLQQWKCILQIAHTIFLHNYDVTTIHRPTKERG